MAEVYLARMRGPMNFQKMCVVKTIHPEMASQEQFLNMLLDEARVSALIKHPRVVDIYDLGHERDTYFIAMEYLDGQPLSAVMAAGGRGDALDVYSTARLIADAAEGLHAAHELKSSSGRALELVHRDVSPGNIIVLYDGSVKIVDFGIAKARGRLTTSGMRQLKGKVGYMSPEQGAGEHVDRRSDIYSLGVVLWEAMTLTRLFPGTDEENTEMRMLHKDMVPLPSSIRPQVVRELDDVCLTALASKPEDRFQTAKDMIDAIEGVLRSVGYYRESGMIGKYMTRVFADRRNERLALMNKRAVTLSGLDAVREENSGPDMVMEVTVETSAPDRVLPQLLRPADSEEIKAENVVTHAEPLRKRRRSNAALWAVVSLLLLAGAGVGLYVLSDQPATPPKRAEVVEAKPAAAVADKAVAADPKAAPAASTAPTASTEGKKRPASAAAAREPAKAKADDGAQAAEETPEGEEGAEAEDGSDKPSRPGAPRRRNAGALYEEGTALFIQGKAAAAKQKFKEAIAISPTHAPSFRGLGLAYQALGQKAKAAAALERYLRLAPSAGDAEQIRARLEKLK